MAVILNSLGFVLRDLGKRDSARQSFEEALEIVRRLATQHPAAFEPNLATTLNNLGIVLGERDAAQEMLMCLKALLVFGVDLRSPPDVRPNYRELWETSRDSHAAAPENARE